MEVHQHSHTPRKKWTHYFWEFLMLFLAVTLGFFVENQREHMVEHRRAKEYAKSLIEDLKKDVAEINGMSWESIQVIKSFDSIKTFVYRGIKNNHVQGSFYYYSRIGTIVPIVTWNKATLNQIIQSGSLRYFANHELIKKISSYYANTDEINGQHQTDRGFREKSVEIRNPVLNNYYYSRYSGFNIDSTIAIDSLFTMQVSLQKSEPDLLNEYANSFENRRATLRNLTTMYFPRALHTANELIELLRKEYHLK